MSANSADLAQFGLLGAVVDGLDVALAVVSSDGAIVYANPKAAQSWGASAMPGTASWFADLWCDERVIVGTACRAFAAQNAWRPYRLHARNDGRQINLKGRRIRLDPADPTGLIVIMADVISKPAFGEAVDRQRRSMGERALTSLNGARSALHMAHVRQCELVHRTKNHLAMLGSLVRIARRDARVNPAEALSQFESRLAAMTAVHTVLDRGRSGELVRADELMMALCDGLRELMSGHGIALVARLEPMTLDVAEAVPLGLLANEAVTNALKHAFPGGRGGTVTVTLSIDDTDIVSFRVRDDGVGVSGGRAARSGSGSDIIARLSEQLHAELSSGPVPGHSGHEVHVRFRPGTLLRTPVARPMERDRVAAL